MRGNLKIFSQGFRRDHIPVGDIAQIDVNGPAAQPRRGWQGVRGFGQVQNGWTGFGLANVDVQLGLNADQGLILGYRGHGSVVLRRQII